MSVKTLIAMFATVAASFAAPTIVQAAQEKPAMQTTPKPGKSGHAAVNGVNYYYAVYGTGEPLLLLHGGLGQIEMFGPNLTKLAQRRQVIGVDLQGHGRTSLGNREISLVDMGNDMAGVLKKLGTPAMSLPMSTRLISRLPSDVRPWPCRSTPITCRLRASLVRLGPNISIWPRPPWRSNSGSPVP